MSNAPYITDAELKASASIPSGAADADVTRAVIAASNAIDEMTNRRSRGFRLDATDKTRKYTATTRCLVIVDDISTITSLTSDGVAVTDYLAKPLNAVADSRPFTQLSTSSERFTLDEGAIAVTGRFGWPEIPEQVKQMATIIAAKLLKRTREAPFGVVNVGGLDGSALRIAREDPDIQLMLRPLVRVDRMVW